MDNVRALHPEKTREDYAIALASRCVGLATSIRHRFGPEFDQESAKHGHRDPTQLLAEIGVLAAEAREAGIFE